MADRQARPAAVPDRGLCWLRLPASRFSDDFLPIRSKSASWLQRQAIQVRVVPHQALFDQLIDQLVAQPFDVHRVAAGEEADAFLQLGGAGRVGAADVDAAFVLDQPGAARRDTSAGNGNAGKSVVRSCFSTRTMCGMILPAFSTTTTSPTRMSLRSISSALCRLARLTVVPASCDRLQFGHRRDRSGLADLDVDRQQPRRGFPLLPLVSDHPARALRRRSQPLTLGEVVHLQHQPVDLEIQFVQPLDQSARSARRRRRTWESTRPSASAAGRIRRSRRRKSMCVRGLDALAVAHAVAEHAQPAFGADPRVQHPHSAGRQIARIGERRLSGCLLPLVQRDQVRVGHVDFAADFQHRRHIAAGQPQGHVADRPHVVRDVVARRRRCRGSGPAPARRPRRRSPRPPRPLSVPRPIRSARRPAADWSAARTRAARRCCTCFRSTASARGAATCVSSGDRLVADRAAWGCRA